MRGHVPETISYDEANVMTIRDVCERCRVFISEPVFREAQHPVSRPRLRSLSR